MMAAVSTTIRMDSEVKAQAEVLFAQVGLDITAAVNMFLLQAIHEGGVHFHLRSEQPAAGDLTARWTPEQWVRVDAMLQESEAELKAGKYSDAFEDLERLGQKYGI